MSGLYQFAYTAAPDDEVLDMVVALVDAYDTTGSLARVLGVTRPTVYDWQRGAIPRPETYDRIAELHSHLTAWDTAATEKRSA